MLGNHSRKEKQNAMLDMQMTHLSYILHNFSTDMSSVIG